VTERLPILPRHAALALGALLGLAACADGSAPSDLMGVFGRPAPVATTPPVAAEASAPRAAQVGYVPPDGAPAGPVRLSLSGSPERIVDRLAGALADAGLAVDLADRRRGIVVATFAGDPASYVDCGNIFVFPVGTGAQPRRFPAEAAEVTLDLGSPAAPQPMARELRLDARLAVQLVPRGSQFEVEGAAIYVLTKTVQAAGGPPVRDVVSFRSGESARFARGTRCQSNGRLERLVASALAGSA
jgi:hypothetical protein